MFDHVRVDGNRITVSVNRVKAIGVDSVTRCNPHTLAVPLPSVFGVIRRQLVDVTLQRLAFLRQIERGRFRGKRQLRALIRFRPFGRFAIVPPSVVLSVATG